MSGRYGVSAGHGVHSSLIAKAVPKDIEPITAVDSSDLNNICATDTASLQPPQAARVKGDRRGVFAETTRTRM